ncbi:MAG: FtsX-like permease family protein, partial [Sediminibacterium sp.]
SMLVPRSFMQWANQKFATTALANPSRLIIKTKDPSDPRLINYLSKKGLKTDSEKTRFSKFRRIVDIAVLILGGSGLIMLIFAVLIVTLFIQLTVTSCKPEIILLLTLGCSPRELTNLLLKKFFSPGLLLVTIGTLATAVLQYISHYLLQKKQVLLDPFLSPYTLLVACTLILLIAAANRYSIIESMNYTKKILPKATNGYPNETKEESVTA